MSEQQVLPPIDQEIRKYGCWAVEKRFGVNWNAFIYPIFKLDAEGRAGDIVAELACVLHDLGTREAQLSTTLASLAQSEAERERLQRKLALIFDQSCYSDSLGVEGSSFLVCRWCGGGSGPGGKPAFSHNKGCLLDNDELEKEVAGVWEEVPELEKELSTSQIELARERELNQGLRKEVTSLQDELFEMCKLCHKYQNELWADAKIAAEDESKPVEEER